VRAVFLFGKGFLHQPVGEMGPDGMENRSGRSPIGITLITHVIRRSSRRGFYGLMNDRLMIAIGGLFSSRRPGIYRDLSADGMISQPCFQPRWMPCFDGWHWRLLNIL
jgi:hypothetical protein